MGRRQKYISLDEYCEVSAGITLLQSIKAAENRAADDFITFVRRLLKPPRTALIIYTLQYTSWQLAP
jgi:hypothetical protein